jgi:ribosomal protein S12 methylthiotransferase accessory factor
MEIHVTFPGGKQVDAMVGNFIIRTDQPLSDGGGGASPSPFDLFLVSLATCAGYYVQAFCQARKIPTDRLHVIQRAEKDPKSGALRSIAIEVHVPPDFPPEYRDSIVRAAAACKVKKTIENPPSFQIGMIIDQAYAA